MGSRTSLPHPRDDRGRADRLERAVRRLQGARRSLTEAQREFVAAREDLEAAVLEAHQSAEAA